MRALLLAAATTAGLILSAPPLSAEPLAFAGSGPTSGMTQADGPPRLVQDRCRWGRDFGRSDHQRRRAGRAGCGGSTVVMDWYGGEWARYNNRGWDPDSYNDWWHDRPDRAYPRWVQEQQRAGTCSEDRMWWSGSGWHC